MKELPTRLPAPHFFCRGSVIRTRIPPLLLSQSQSLTVFFFSTLSSTLQAARADAKKVREAAKKNLKKEKKALRTIITSSNYFQPAGTAASVSIIEAQLNELDALCAALEPEEVVALRERAEKAGEGAKGELAQASDSKGLTTGAFK